MTFFDTHAHLYAEQFDDDRDDMLRRAREQGVERFYLPNIDSGSIASMLALEEKHPESCIPMMGLHPCSVKANYEEELALVEDWLGRRDFVAVGEIGIDLYWDKTYVQEQEDAFLRQIRWARELGKPIVIHSRDSLDRTIELVRQEQDGALRGVYHCFGGSVEQARAIEALGFYMGIGGVITFKKAGLDKTLEELTLDHLVLETDAPYLAPVPFRGKRNESAYIPVIAAKVAEVMEQSIEMVAEVTTRNAAKVFGG